MLIVAKSRMDINTSFFSKTYTIETKNKIALRKYLAVKVTDINTSSVKLFKNNKDAAKYLGIG